MNFSEIERQADQYFKANQIQLAIAQYKSCVQGNIESHYQIYGLGSIQDQNGYYRGQVAKWYINLKCNGVIKGSPLDALALIYTHNSYIHFAKDFFLSLLDLFPNNYHITLCLGHAHFNLKQYSKAIEYYQKAISINSQAQHGYYALASLYFYHFDELVKARQLVLKALAFNSQHQLSKIIQVYTSQVKIQYKMQKLADLSDRDILIAPKINNLIGCLLFQDGSFHDSQIYFSKCLQQSCSYIAPYVGLSSALIQLGSYQDAYYFLLECVKIGPGSYQILNNLGNVCLSTERLQQAIQWFFSSTECRQHNFEALYGLGNCYFLQNDFDSAIDWFKQAVQKGKSRYQVYKCLGNCFILTQQYELALQNYLKCFELSRSIDNFIEILKLLITMQNYQKSIQMIKQQEYNFEEPLHQIYYLLGYSYLMLDLNSQAKIAFQKSIRDSPQFQLSVLSLNAIRMMCLKDQ